MYNISPFPTIPACSSVGEPFSEIGRESAPPVALKGERNKTYYEPCHRDFFNNKLRKTCSIHNQRQTNVE